MHREEKGYGMKGVREPDRARCGGLTGPHQQSRGPWEDQPGGVQRPGGQGCCGRVRWLPAPAEPSPRPSPGSPKATRGHWANFDPRRQDLGELAAPSRVLPGGHRRPGPVLCCGGWPAWNPSRTSASHLPWLPSLPSLSLPGGLGPDPGSGVSFVSNRAGCSRKSRWGPNPGDLKVSIVRIE